MTAPRIFDRDLLSSRRDRVAATARSHDFLLSRVADELIERLAAINRRFDVALDLGSHHGVLARALTAQAGVGLVVSADPARHLVALAPAPKVVADEEALPFRAQAFDLIVSGLALHLTNDLPGVLAQARQCLKPDGLLLATVLGGRTLEELRAAVLAAEIEVEGGASPRVAPFADIRDLGGLLQRAGFALPAIDADVVTVTWPSPLALMREIKAMGASNPLSDRRRVPASRKLIARACEIYADRYLDKSGRVPATFELITLTGWAPHESQQKPLKPGSARVSLAKALRPGDRDGGHDPA